MSEGGFTCPTCGRKYHLTEKGEARCHGCDLIDGLEKFVADLKSGGPIHVTTVRRKMKPDGPMHTRTKGTL